ncbi:family 6 glucosyltransferase [Aeromonas enteropelogenes]|uniref:family 6 glucosyltransferase n=1 Tax=Aeromonas enteropelogenes TaxID=29489 RepID=UPI003B9F9B17
MSDKIAVLYVATGNYIDFWDAFYSSSERNFSPGVIKHYFVFTDAPDDVRFINENNNVTTRGIDRLSWPLNTLLRFEYFHLVIDELEAFDYIIFLNANAEFITTVHLEELFDNTSDLVGVQHPGYMNWRYIFLPYERKNKFSQAYLKPKKSSVYYQGCLSGGKASAYIELIKTCRNNINYDLKNNIIARAHDESHINKYFNNHKVHTLDFSYSFPEDYGQKGDIRILMRNKNRFSWYADVKNPSNKKSTILRLKHKLKKLVVEK